MSSNIANLAARRRSLVLGRRRARRKAGGAGGTIGATARFWEIQLDQNANSYFRFYTVDMFNTRVSQITGSETYTASRDDGVNPIENAFDGDPATSWQSGVAGDEWIRVEFAEPTEIDEIHIFPVNADNAPDDFRVRKSNDGVNWVVVKEFLDGDFAIDDVVGNFLFLDDFSELVSGQSRYVMLEFYEARGGPSDIYDFEEVEFLLAGVDQATGGTATAQDTFSSFVAAQAFDDNNATRWVSATGADNFLKYDMGAGNTIEFDAISITPDFDPRAPRRFSIQVSDDDVTYTKLRDFHYPRGWATQVRRVIGLRDQ